MIYDAYWTKAPGLNQSLKGLETLWINLEVIREIEENQHVTWNHKYKRPGGYINCAQIMCEIYICHGLFIPVEADHEMCFN